MKISKKFDDSLNTMRWVKLKERNELKYEMQINKIIWNCKKKKMIKFFFFEFIFSLKRETIIPPSKLIFQSKRILW